MPDSMIDTQAPHSEQLEDYDVTFLEHLEAEAETTLSHSQDFVAAHELYKQILERYARDGRLRKADLYAIDRLVLAMASPGELRAEAPGLYKRYCDERGEAIDPADPAMERPKPDKPEDAEAVESLRARLQQILRSLHWSYAFGPLREKRRVKLIEEAMWLMVGATGILAVVLALLYYFGKAGGYPFFAVLATAIYAGVMGGAVSCTRRLGAVPTRGDALGSIHALKNSRYVLYFAPLTGAVFAVITMLLFIGHVITGTVFPAFQDLAAAGHGRWPFVDTLVPANSQAYALLFLWCFIAGFAERFIPDTLAQLTQRANAQSAAADPAKKALKKS
ncbi:MAG: hypothetical protein LAP87_06115 [Acidobacteriia bacterium]|nr:hypothetical protein [Terriglobia bacterium]